MSQTDPLLVNNQAFAAAGRHRQVGMMPRYPVFVITCLDPRTDPAGFLGLAPGDAVVVRNAGGRVTPAVIADIALIGQLAESMAGSQGPLFEVAVVHHTQCGTGMLVQPGFRHAFAERTGTDETTLAAQAVVEPEHTVRLDVELLRSSILLSDRHTVSGYVLDLDTGLVRTVVPVSPIHTGLPRVSAA